MVIEVGASIRDMNESDKADLSDFVVTDEMIQAALTAYEPHPGNYDIEEDIVAMYIAMRLIEN